VRVVIFTHSLISDWNHGNAHFLRGIASELLHCGHQVTIFEPRDGWSLRNLLAEHPCAITEFRKTFPHLRSILYDPETLDLDRALAGASLVIVHEWNPHELVARLGCHRARTRGYKLFFHDTHHRSVTDPGAMSAYDLTHYDGVFAYGSVIRDLYMQNGWARAAWTLHEAADVRVFQPRPADTKEGDLVWIGNWGDDERTDAIREFLVQPVRELRLKARVYGVRYPASALAELLDAGIEYGGWLPNYRVPEVFSRFRATVHIPRRPYTRQLPGIPTIRPFEALACGIPLISAPWDDTEQLFRPGQDLLYASDGAEMVSRLRHVLTDPGLANSLAACGLEIIRERHTCAHRVTELMARAGGAA
jgi:spore maturation protein CgeB